MNLRIISLIVSIFISATITSFAQSWAWAKTTDTGSWAATNAVKTDGWGNVYVAGIYRYYVLRFGAFTFGGHDYNDIFLVKYDPDGNVIWAKTYGGGGEDIAQTLALDNSGHIYMAGYFTSSSITFGATTLTNLSHTDMFVVKLDTSGSLLWARNTGGCDSDLQVKSIVTDNDGNLYAGGFFKGNVVNFDTCMLSNAAMPGTYSADVFVTKFDPAGNVIWARSAGGTADDEAISLTTDLNNNLYVAGYFNSDAGFAFDTTTLPRIGFNDLFFVKYSADGQVRWAKNFGNPSSNFQKIYMCSDANGYIYQAGSSTATHLQLGSTLLTNPRIYLSKFDTSGSLIWARSIVTGTFGIVNSIAADHACNLYICGNFSYATITFGSITLSNISAFATNIFLAKYDSAGAQVWVKSIDNVSDVYANSISVDSFGSAYIGGYFFDTFINFGAHHLINYDFHINDMYVAKFMPGTTKISGLTPDQDSIKIWPNPNMGKFIISNPDPLHPIREIHIYNSVGQEVFKQYFKVHEPYLQVDLPELKDGCYTLMTISDSKIIYNQIIIHKA